MRDRPYCTYSTRHSTGGAAARQVSTMKGLRPWTSVQCPTTGASNSNRMELDTKSAHEDHIMTCAWAFTQACSKEEGSESMQQTQNYDVEVEDRTCAHLRSVSSSKVLTVYDCVLKARGKEIGEPAQNWFLILGV